MRIYWLKRWTVVALLLCSALSPSLCTAEPILQRLPLPESVVLGDLFALEVELSWQGAGDQYSSVPPAVALGEWATVDSVSTTTSFSADHHRIRHTLQIRPLQTGDFSVPDFQVPYFTPAETVTVSEGDAPVATYPTLSAGLVNIRVIESSDSVLILMGIGLAGLIALSLGWSVSRRRTLAQASGIQGLSVPVLIHEAQQSRLDGNYYTFYQTLLRGTGLLTDSPEKKALQQRYEELRLAVGYKGVVPEEGVLDEAMRELERLHAQGQGIKEG